MDRAPLRRRGCVAFAVVAVLTGAGACGGGSGSSRPSFSPSGIGTRSPAPPAATATVAPPTDRPAVTPTRTRSEPTRTQEATTEPTTQPTTAAAGTPAPIAAAASNDETPWGWIIGILVAVAAVVGGALWLAARRRRQRLLTWRNDTESSLRSALLARDLLPESGRHIPDATHWQSVRDRVEQAAQGLDLAAASAPTPEAGRTATNTARAMRDLTFALESERLLEDGVSPPTPEQLAEADTTTRARQAELQTALQQLELVVRPSATGAPTAQ